ncbi:hypothetical protein DFH06DRAFT_1437879 [Mycena polygramma]|nr:hypothetical protein DFH06DRAFT_1437879 [Mycena polygramma]
MPQLATQSGGSEDPVVKFVRRSTRPVRTEQPALGLHTAPRDSCDSDNLGFSIGFWAVQGIIRDAPQSALSEEGVLQARLSERLDDDSATTTCDKREAESAREIGKDGSVPVIRPNSTIKFLPMVDTLEFPCTHSMNVRGNRGCGERDYPPQLIHTNRYRTRAATGVPSSGRIPDPTYRAPLRLLRRPRPRPVALCASSLPDSETDVHTGTLLSLVDILLSASADPSSSPHPPTLADARRRLILDVVGLASNAVCARLGRVRAPPLRLGV